MKQSLARMIDKGVGQSQQCRLFARLLHNLHATLQGKKLEFAIEKDAIRKELSSYISDQYEKVIKYAEHIHVQHTEKVQALEQIKNILTTNNHLHRAEYLDKLESFKEKQLSQLLEQSFRSSSSTKKYYEVVCDLISEKKPSSYNELPSHFKVSLDRLAKKINQNGKLEGKMFKEEKQKMVFDEEESIIQKIKRMAVQYKKMKDSSIKKPEVDKFEKGFSIMNNALKKKNHEIMHYEKQKMNKSQGERQMVLWKDPKKKYQKEKEKYRIDQSVCENQMHWHIEKQFEDYLKMMNEQLDNIMNIFEIKISQKIEKEFMKMPKETKKLKAIHSHLAVTQCVLMLFKNGGKQLKSKSKQLEQCNHKLEEKVEILRVENDQAHKLKLDHFRQEIEIEKLKISLKEEKDKVASMDLDVLQKVQHSLEEIQKANMTLIEENQELQEQCDYFSKKLRAIVEMAAQSRIKKIKSDGSEKVDRRVGRSLQKAEIKKEKGRK